MNVLPSTWAFRCKRYPDRRVRKLKARFCVRGDTQIEGIDYFDTDAPVVSWITVRLLLILSIVLNLHTMQVDYTAAFLHDDLEEEIFVEMPHNFRKPGRVYRLRKSLYGLKQSPKNFFKTLNDTLTNLDFKPSRRDRCLFIHLII